MRIVVGMDELEPFASLGVALFAGLLIGFEREQSLPERPQDQPSFLGGARTYPLFALVGAVAMLLSAQVGVSVVVATFLATAALVGVNYAIGVTRRGDSGLTSEAALMLSFLLGALATTDRELFPSTERKVSVVASIAVVATLLLSIKPVLHTTLRQVTKNDVLATLKFLLVSVVVLPLLPNRDYGPLEALNPYKIGILVVLIAAISFVGYLAVRLLGTRRGIGLTGLVGGLASSTAVTLTFSGRAREEPRLVESCALAIVLASSIMFARVVLTVQIVNPPLAAELAWPMGAMGLTGMLASAWFYRRSTASPVGEGVVLSNPFELTSALRFAFIFAVVLLVTKAVTTYLGTGATYVAGALGGLTDVDALTLSMAQLAKSSLSGRVAVTTIIIGAMSNTMVKAGLAIGIGGWQFGRRIAATFGLVVLAGFGGLVMLWR
jgi:uncharacterized membrane protein (DUF4010 family)